MAEAMPLLEVIPQPYAWTGPVTDASSEGRNLAPFVKVFTHLTCLAPMQAGALATVVLTVDPGFATQRIVTVVFDLSGAGASTVNGVPFDDLHGNPLDTTPLHTTTLSDAGGGEIRGHLARLSVSTNVPSPGPAPQVWAVTAWGTAVAPLAVRT